MQNRLLLSSISALCLAGLALTPALAASQTTANTTNNTLGHQVYASVDTSSDSASAAHHEKGDASDSAALTDDEASSGDHHFSLDNKLGLGPKSRIRINGFMSAGFLKTTDGAIYPIPGHGNIINKMNFEAASLIGLQITGNITDNLSVVTQLVADGDDSNGNKPFAVNADWAYLRYQLNNDIQLRAGRFRLPAFIYSETQQVGYSYPWVTLPNEVYSIVPVFNLDGVGGVFTLPLGQSGWSVKAQPFFGSNKSKMAIYQTYRNPPLPPGTIVNFEENDVLGSSVSISDEYLTLKALYMRLTTSAYTNLFEMAPGGQGGAFVHVPLANNLKMKFYSFGAKFNYDNFLFAGEYAHRISPELIANLAGYYGMVGYHIGKFLPNFTYAHVDTTNTEELKKTEGQKAIAQRSLTLGLNYYINSNLVVKASASQVTPLDGTSGFFSEPTGKKHVMLYGLSVDAIF